MSPHATRLLLVLASLSSVEEETHELVGKLLEEHLPRLVEIATKFRLQEVSPSSSHKFERELDEALRELGRQLTERVYNSLEPEQAEQMPHHVRYEAGGYRRRNDKTRNAHVATLFGGIELRRYAYREWHGNDACIFPLEMQLGLVQGATPALAEAAARYLAEAGATQNVVLSRLKQQHGVSWGPERLRAVAREVAEAMTAVRQDVQVERVLELLRKADESSGNRLPVLSVGRDGISLREYRYRFFENATAATVTVYDRGGKRLGTVYLAFAPELEQPTMTQQLTSLITRVLECWEGTLPRLAYVTDAGDSESKYWRRVLRTMRHPRTDQPLRWHRIVDYYHASERLWKMAECLFGRQKDGTLSREARAWALRMCRLLKKPNGPYRMLHAAAAQRARRKLSPTREKEYRRAYNYIRRRTKFMQYAEYKNLHLPLGSGVTEAACKTIFTQRLKLSGMRWTKPGAQTILDLRVLLLSGAWDAAYARVLASEQRPTLKAYEPRAEPALQNAA
jgi:NAD(P)-dependent dehydrogenase (short-subunit alcohol dehydrogenase family)